jgi:hypothetical protein
MDSNLKPNNVAPSGSASLRVARAGHKCSVNQLTLVTLVIALAGFAGTAFAADPPSFDPQAVPTAAATC